MAMSVVQKVNNAIHRINHSSSLVCWQNSSHSHSLDVNIFFNCSTLGWEFIYAKLGKSAQLFNFKTMRGGEICSADVNMHKVHEKRNYFSG